MMKKALLAIGFFLVTGGTVMPTHAAEAGAAPVPPGVMKLVGCWQGEGLVMKKPVTIRIAAAPIVESAMLAVDVSSAAVADGTDRYAAHLLFGGAPHAAGHKDGDRDGDRITGYWADSFGGAYATTGVGASTPSGFEMTYRYPDAVFTNRWRIDGAQKTLTWDITSRPSKNPSSARESVFAHYALHATTCPRA